MTHVTCRLTAKNRDQLRNPTLCKRVWATFTFLKNYVLFPAAGQYAEAKADLQLATDFLKNTYAANLRGYAGDNVHYILDLLRPPQLEAAISTSGLRSPPEVVYDDVIAPTSGTSWRRRRSKWQRPLAAAVDFENGGGHGKPEPEVDIVVLDGSPEAGGEVDVAYRAMSAWNDTAEAKYAERYTYVTRLLKIAHGLHYVGIGILGIFVVQVPACCTLVPSIAAGISVSTRPFNGPLSGTTRASRYQKGKTNLDFTEARDSEWRWHQLGCMQAYT